VAYIAQNILIDARKIDAIFAMGMIKYDGGVSLPLTLLLTLDQIKEFCYRTVGTAIKYSPNLARWRWFFELTRSEQLLLYAFCRSPTLHNLLISGTSTATSSV